MSCLNSVHLKTLFSVAFAGLYIAIATLGYGLHGIFGCCNCCDDAHCLELAQSWEQPCDCIFHSKSCSSQTVGGASDWNSCSFRRTHNADTCAICALLVQMRSGEVNFDFPELSTEFTTELTICSSLSVAHIFERTCDARGPPALVA